MLSPELSLFFWHTERLLASFANPDTIFYQETRLSSNEISRSFIHTRHPADLNGLPWIFRRLLGQQDGRDFVPAEKKTCVNDMISLLHSARPCWRVRHSQSGFPNLRHIWNSVRISSFPLASKSTQRPKETLLRLQTWEARATA